MKMACKCGNDTVISVMWKDGSMTRRCMRFRCLTHWYLHLGNWIRLGG